MDLRFTSSEAAEFLNQVMRLNLATEDIVALDERTEGWIAGLQLAAISMQGHEDTRGLIKSFTGSHRFVLDYLIEEVLEQQPAPIQNFLLQTAILSRLTGALCNAVTEQEGSQAILEMLDHDNLFIVPLDEERLWYRYHHLFAGLLKQRLQQSHHPTQVSTIHHRASLWYEENGFTEKSIEHALRGEDFERAAQLIEVVAESVWMRGVDTRLRHWLARLPDDLLLSQPRLCIFHAWYLLAGGNQVAADRVLTNVEVALERRQHTPLDGGSALHGRLATIQAFSAFYRGDVRAIIRSARTALEYLPEEALSWRSTATHLLGDAYDFNGEFREGYQFRLAAVQTSRASGNQVQIVIANLKLATNLRYQGRLQEAIEICQQQQMFANESGMAQTVVGGWLLAIWGEALAEINDLDEAIHKVRQGVEICERGGDLAMGGWSYLCLIRVLFSRGDLPGAGAIVHKLENLARESFVPPWIMNLNAAWQARLWLGQGKLDRVAQWAEERGLDVNSNPGYVHEMEYTMLARLLIANKKLDMATALLQRQLEAAEAGGRTSRVIEILILRAFVFHKEGDTARAMSALEEALTLAAPGGFIRIFVDEGAPMAQLLFRANDAGVMPVYVATLLSAIATRSEPPGDTLAPPHAPQPSPLIEPLSDRELEVLQLVAQGLTNREIGERLYLALDTVKGHNRRIYGKLQVHRRIDAIARARDLGLL